MVQFTDGTLCDLTNSPRQTKVYYICNEVPSRSGEIKQIEETSTCEYSVIVLLAELCQHPSYRYICFTAAVVTLSVY